MLDYIFFHEYPCRRFCDFLRRRGVDFEEREDSLGMTVSVPAGLSEALADELDELYEALMREQERLLSAEDEEAMAALTVALQDGRILYVPAQAEVVDRILDAVGPQALQHLVDAVASAVEASMQDTPPAR